jgi:flagellar hook-basal body complex protein FliE
MPAIDSTRLLMELRSLAAEAQRAPANTTTTALGDAGGSKPPDFGSILKDSISQVSAMQQSSEQLGAAFEQGQPGIDITRVMVEAQKATLAFRAMTEVRNRLVSAYQDVMNMPV